MVVLVGLTAPAGRDRALPAVTGTVSALTPVADAVAVVSGRLEADGPGRGG